MILTIKMPSLDKRQYRKYERLPCLWIFYISIHKIISITADCYSKHKTPHRQFLSEDPDLWLIYADVNTYTYIVVC